MHPLAPHCTVWAGMPGAVDHVLAGLRQPDVASDRFGGCVGRAGFGECGLRRRHHERIAVVRAEVQDLTGGDQAHVLGLAAERSDGESTADRLGERDEVGLHAELARSRRRSRP